MKRIFSMLFHHHDGDWWDLSESDSADPPNERHYMFTYDNLITVIKRKLAKLGAKDETEISS